MPKMATLEELRMTAKFDKGMQDQLGLGLVMEDGEAAPQHPAVVEMMSNSAETIFYHGDPIKIGDKTLGSFCVMGPQKPSKYDEVKATGFLRDIAAKGAMAVEAQAKVRRERQLAQIQMMMHPAAPMYVQMQAQKWHTAGMTAMPPAGLTFPQPMTMGAQGMPMINSNYFQQLQGQGQMAGMFGLEANPPQSPGDMGAAAPPMNPNLPPPSPAFPMNPSQQMLAMQQQQMMQLHMQ